MLRVIRRSISLANAPSLTEAEYGIRAKDWCELLEAVIPEERLMDSFMRAARDHASAFPVNAYEIQDAWKNIQAEEQARRETEAVDDVSAIDTCGNKANHVLENGEDHGLVELYDPTDNSTRIVPCFTCRRAAFDQRQAEYIASKEGAGIAEVAADFVDIALKAMEPVKDDGRELLTWAYESVKAEYLNHNRRGKPRWTKDDLTNAAVILSDAIVYIKLGPENYARTVELRNLSA
jgi:hypothetical protein